jgi:hypothetical protein
MVTVALRAPFRATGHMAAWLVWHTMRISLLNDLEAPQPPGGDLAREAA